MNRLYAFVLSCGLLFIFLLSSCLETRQYTNDLDMTFKLIGIAPMEFMIGSPSSEPGRHTNELRHKVRLTRNYYIQTTEVTQRQWEQVMGDNPSFHTECGEDCPVEGITWYEAAEFCNRLSDREGLTPAYSISGDEVTWDQSANGYRLPTEAEWEHASILVLDAGITVDPNRCDVDPNLDPIAWYCGNAGGTTHPVARKDNTGIAGKGYDTLGNVWEWCWDWYAQYSVDDPNTAITDPMGPASPSSTRIKVIRGGGAYDLPRACRPAKRQVQDPSRRALTGLRPARYEQVLDTGDHFERP